MTGGKHRKDIYLLVAVGLLACSAFFLYLEHVTHFEFLLHLAAIPLEILLGALLVERFMARKEKQDKKQQLMYIKSYIFRSEMRNVFLFNFRALESPAISIKKIHYSSLEELREMLAGIGELKYRSEEEMEAVVMAYARSHNVFHTFLEWSIANDFEEIFNDMIYVLHFIQDVKLYKNHHPGKLFIHEAMKQPAMIEKVYHIFRDGVCKFLEYAIELKEKQPEVFEELMEDYQFSATIKPGKEAEGEQEFLDLPVPGKSLPPGVE